jgi:hypothetical protein
MIEIYEITLQAEKVEEPAKRITIRVVGLPREAAIKLAHERVGPGYREIYIINGPRFDYYNLE